MLDIEQFMAQVVELVKDNLCEEYGDCSVELVTVPKNNGVVLRGFTVKFNNENIAPILYLGKAYDAYMEGEEISKLAKEATEQVIALRTKALPSFDENLIYNFDKVVDKIVPVVVNGEKNEWLDSRNIPSRCIAEGLRVYLKVNLESFDEGIPSIKVSNDMLKNWGITFEAALDIAKSNIEPTFKSMGEVLGIGNIDPFYVMTTTDKICGAAAILDEVAMDKIYDELGEYYVLPSSIHEVLVLPKEGAPEPQILRDMIQDINKTEVRNEDYLSDYLYAYNPDRGLHIVWTN